MARRKKAAAKEDAGRWMVSYADLLTLLFALFVVLYGVIVLKRNIGVFFVILAFVFPGLLLMLIMSGFLYGAGPLRDFLERRRQVKL